MTDRAAKPFLVLTLALLMPLAWASVALAQKSSSFAPKGGLGGPASSAIPAEPVRVSARLDKTVLAPNDQAVIAVILDFAEHWHAWPSEAQDVLPDDVASFAIRTEITLNDAPAWISTVGPTQWPEPHKAAVPDVMNPGKTIQVPVYQGRAIAYIPIIVGSEIAPAAGSLSLSVTYQACNETVCLPPETADLDIAVDLVPSRTEATASSPDAEHLAIFTGFDQSVYADLVAGRLPAKAVDFNAFGLTFSIDATGTFGLALLLLIAAVGGLLLNLTPCVLPVIPLKIMGLAASAGNPRRTLLLGVVMSIGVVTFWLGLGAAVALVSGFDAISSLFQQSWFSIVVGAVIAIMGVGMLGLFTVRLPKAVYLINPSHETFHGSFLFGIMTAVLATPCTAPFMGTAAVWATRQTTAVTMLTFGVIGAGMALPYLILSARPKWVSKMPRTGPASELVKQVMGLLMMAVATFFLGNGIGAVMTTPPDAPATGFWWIVAAIVFVASGWLALRTFQLTPSLRRRAVFGVVAVVLAGGALTGARWATDKGPIDWVPYTPERFADARADGKIVVIDFTAGWCLNCKVIERTVLFRDEVASRLSASDVVPMKVDLTGDNKVGQAMLRQAGSVAIPYLAIYAPTGDSPVFTADAYTPEQVLQGIATAAGVPPDPRTEGGTPVADSD